MTQKEAIIIEKYFDAEYIVQINDSGYIDSNIQGIYENEETGEYVYDSEVFSERPLSEVYIGSVIIAKPIHDLLSSEIEYLCEQDKQEVTHVDKEGV